MVKTLLSDLLILVQALPEPRPNDAMLPARNSANELARNRVGTLLAAAATSRPQA